MKNIKEIIKKEGDFFEWTYFAKNGLEVDCYIRRNNSLAFCGYVVITFDNKLYALEYDNISSKIDFYPHGGLTYSNQDKNGNWIIGFDCAHAGDLCPAFPHFDGIYRTKDFVISECEKLAEEVSKFSGIIKRLQNIESVIGRD
jgi:hypothetical protein